MLRYHIDYLSLIFVIIRNIRGKETRASDCEVVRYAMGSLSVFSLVKSFASLILFDIANWTLGNSKLASIMQI